MDKTTRKNQRVRVLWTGGLGTVAEKATQSLPPR